MASGSDYLVRVPGRLAITLQPARNAYFKLGCTDMPLGLPSGNRIEYKVPNGTNPVFSDLRRTARAYPNPNRIYIDAVHLAPAFPARASRPPCPTRPSVGDAVFPINRAGTPLPLP